MEYKITIDYKIMADNCCDIAPEFIQKLGSITMPINVNDYHYSDSFHKLENVFFKTLDIQMAKAVISGL